MPVFLGKRGAGAPSSPTKAMAAPRGDNPVAESTREAIENSYLLKNSSSLNGDVSSGDNLGSLILIKPKPAAS
jgi:hypothetical protein